jgi:hypothetical protein
MRRHKISAICIFFHAMLPIVALTLAAFTLLSRPALAQSYDYTLSGVTFNDGAIASGFFTYDPTASTIGSYDITTTPGTDGDGTVGYHYDSTDGGSYANPGNNPYFIFGQSNFGPNNLFLESTEFGNTSGTISLIDGSPNGIGSFFGSGEFYDANSDYRLVSTGSINVTPAPEASSAVTFTLLLLLSGSALVFVRRKNKLPA